MKNLKLSGNAQTALIISAAVMILIWRLFLKNTEAKKEKEATDEIKDSASSQTPTAQQATISNTKAAQLAEQAFLAMKGIGTDEEELYSAFNALVNEADAAALDTAFGIRQGESLGAWLLADGEAAEIASIMAQKGIEYKFAIIEI